MSFLEAINTCVGLARNEYTLEEIETMKKECTMVVMEWPILPKKFNRKENTMQYMTNKMLQRFMSNMSTQLMCIQTQRNDIEDEISYCKQYEYTGELPAWYDSRDDLKKTWKKYEHYQWVVKYVFREGRNFKHCDLQFMEKVVTDWIKDADFWIGHNYDNFMYTRGGEDGKYWYNQVQSSKKKLAKLVELQQAIRKQKSITKD